MGKKENLVQLFIVQVFDTKGLHVLQCLGGRARLFFPALFMDPICSKSQPVLTKRQDWIVGRLIEKRLSAIWHRSSSHAIDKNRSETCDFRRPQQTES